MLLRENVGLEELPFLSEEHMEELGLGEAVQMKIQSKTARMLATGPSGTTRILG